MTVTAGSFSTFEGEMGTGEVVSEDDAADHGGMSAPDDLDDGWKYDL